MPRAGTRARKPVQKNLHRFVGIGHLELYTLPVEPGAGRIAGLFPPGVE
jgi:hypothetical protein